MDFKPQPFYHRTTSLENRCFVGKHYYASPCLLASCAEALPLLLAGFGKIWSTGFYEVFEGGQFLLGLASYFLLEEGE